MVDIGSSSVVVVREARPSQTAARLGITRKVAEPIREMQAGWKPLSRAMESHRSGMTKPWRRSISRSSSSEGRMSVGTSVKCLERDEAVNPS